MMQPVRLATRAAAQTSLMAMFFMACLSLRRRMRPLNSKLGVSL